MDAAAVAAMIAMPLSVLLAVIEISRAATGGLFALLRVPMLLYVAILTIGNVFTTWLAAATLHDRLPATGQPWFWYVFIGVFGFEAILKRVNLTFADIGVLSINDWINKARDTTVADVIEASVLRAEINAQQLAGRLMQLPPADLNAYVIDMLGPTQVQALDAAAAAGQANSMLVKALALAKADYRRALAISPK